MKDRLMLARHLNLILLGLIVVLSALFLSQFRQGSCVQRTDVFTQRLAQKLRGSLLQSVKNAAKQEKIDANQLLILIWEDYSDTPTSNAYLSKCEELNCHVTHNRNLLPKAAAVVYYDRAIRLSSLPPKPRLPNQHYVFFLMESAHHVSSVAFNALAKNYYTLTMSYRRDSDLFTPFGFVRPRKTPLETPYTVWKSIALSKPKNAVWMGSFCNTPSKREVYVEKLKQYMQVDVYGKCGDLKCPKTDTAYMKEDQCEQMLKKNYKFYLAFENSVCKDFVTEKVFNRFDSHLVPVVFKRSHVEPLLPKGSFIAADDFKGPKELADYLNYLSANWTAYIEYYKWKDKYEVVPFPSGLEIGMCQLCARLRADNDVQVIYPTESADDVSKWFIGKSECIPNYGLYMSNEQNSTPSSLTE
ncbi:glyco protein 3 alpha L fucosyltransferase A [Trichuris trichiura]|uniref:Fucosyltransferase n=1 Tax=Trichuris trichiura TaxID=36087 RepID=A0A077ZAL2_TRITR|nr:glyco protein 3 alpha L fucosyltransferase A [Trichuris trichiura]